MVETVTAWRLNWGSHIASSVAATTGKYSGRQPAMTALTAAFSAVMTRPLTGSAPRMSEGIRPPASSAARTLSSVGGTTGSPSVQPRSRNASNSAASSSNVSRLDVSGGVVMAAKKIPDSTRSRQRDGATYQGGERPGEAESMGAP